MTAVEPYLGADEHVVQLMLFLEDAHALTPTGLNLPDDLTTDQYRNLFKFLGRVKRASSWWVGDALNAAEGPMGEEFAQAVHETGLEEQTLLNYSYVCRQIPAERRIQNLPFSVHAEVAALPPKEQKAWLKKANEGGWSRSELRARMKAKRAETKPQLPVDDDGAVSPGLLEEIGRAILRDAQVHPDDASLMIVPRDDVIRLEAALGGE